MHNFSIDYGPIDINDQDFEFIRELMYEVAGISIDQRKRVLVHSRLIKRVKELKFPSFIEYIDFVKSSEEEIEYVINSLTTNKTEFFREKAHFDFIFGEYLRDLKKESSRDFNRDPFLTWSAACSTGQEPYSLAILCEEYRKQLLGFKYRVLGTDINSEVLRKCTQGIYSKDDTTTFVPPQIVSKYFIPLSKTAKMSYQISSEIRPNVKFRKFNIVFDELNSNIRFDVILLRNVLIYFDRPSIQKTIDNLTRYLKPGGAFIIGHSESLNGVKHRLKQIKPSVFIKSI